MNELLERKEKKRKVDGEDEERKIKKEEVKAVSVRVRWLVSDKK